MQESHNRFEWGAQRDTVITFLGRLNRRIDMVVHQSVGEHACAVKATAWPDVPFQSLVALVVRRNVLWDRISAYGGIESTVDAC